MRGSKLREGGGKKNKPIGADIGVYYIHVCLGLDMKRVFRYLHEGGDVGEVIHEPQQVLS